MNYPDNNLAAAAQLFRPPTAPPPGPTPAPAPTPKKKQPRASTATAMPAPSIAPQPTAAAPTLVTRTAPTTSIQTVPSAAEQAYTNPAIVPETRQARTTTAGLAPVFLSPTAPSYAVTALQRQLPAAILQNPGQVNLTSTPQAAAALAITSNAQENNPDPGNEGPPQDNRRLKQLLIIGLLVGVGVILLLKRKG